MIGPPFCEVSLFDAKAGFFFCWQQVLNAIRR